MWSFFDYMRSNETPFGEVSLSCSILEFEYNENGNWQRTPSGLVGEDAAFFALALAKIAITSA